MSEHFETKYMPEQSTSIDIPEHEFTIRTATSGGPGGQHANKTASKVELRFDVAASDMFTPKQKELVLEKLSGRINKAGELILHSESERSQHANRKIVHERLNKLIDDALIEPEERKPTKPTRGSVERRLSDKKKHSRKKQERSGSDDEW